MLGWLMWNTMRLLAALGLTVLGGSVVMLIWFMFDVGFAWISYVAIAVMVVILLSFVRRVLMGVGPLTRSSATGEIIE